MLDPKLLRSDLDLVARQLGRRGYALDTAGLAELEEQRKEIQTRAQNLQAERNARAKAVGQAKARGEDIAPLLAQSEALGAQLTQAEAELNALQSRIEHAHLQIPNTPDDSVPDGQSDADNVEVRRWGAPRQFAVRRASGSRLWDTQAMSPYRYDDEFPPLSSATEDGLLLLGGRLTPARVLAAYRRGVFPWPIVERGYELLAWFSPDPRAVIELDRLYVSRRLARRIRSGHFHVTSDRAFDRVIAGCAAPRATDGGTWITADMLRVYSQLHASGHAHSVEVWRDDALAGGLYGHYLTLITPHIPSLDLMFLVLAMAVIGGMGTFAGPVVGALFLEVLAEYIRVWGEFHVLIFSLVALGFARFLPGGIVGLATAWLTRRPARSGKGGAA